MTDEFNLSEKEVNFSLYPNDGCEEMFQKKDVKEFIKRLLKRCSESKNNYMRDVILELAGEKLI